MTTEPVRRSNQRAWLAVVLVVAVIAALMSWRHLRDGRPHAALGATVAAAGELVGTTIPSTVLLPSGQLDIRTTGALEDVPADPAVREQQAPEDGSFVGLHITRSDVPAVTRWTFRDAGSGQTAGTPEPVEVDFALVADGRRYPVTEYDRYGRELDDENDTSSSRAFVPQRSYVAVAGVPKRLELEVTYAGQEQTVDLRTGDRRPGRFAPLYEDRTIDRSCGAVTWQAGYASDVRGPACRIDLAQRTPHYPGFGWAPEGTTWVVVGVVTAEPIGIRYVPRAGQFSRYDSFGLPETTFRLNAAPSRADGLFSSLFGMERRDVVLLTAPLEGRIGTFEVRVDYDNVTVRGDSVRDDSVPYSPKVSASWKVVLP